MTGDTFKRFLNDDLKVKGVLIVTIFIDRQQTGTNVPRVNRSHGSTTPFVSLLCYSWM